MCGPSVSPRYSHGRDARAPLPAVQTAALAGPPGCRGRTSSSRRSTPSDRRVRRRCAAPRPGPGPAASTTSAVTVRRPGPRARRRPTAIPATPAGATPPATVPCHSCGSGAQVERLQRCRSAVPAYTVSLTISGGDASPSPSGAIPTASSRCARAVRAQRGRRRERRRRRRRSTAASLRGSSRWSSPVAASTFVAHPPLYGPNTCAPSVIILPEPMKHSLPDVPCHSAIGPRERDRAPPSAAYVRSCRRPSASRSRSARVRHIVVPSWPVQRLHVAVRPHRRDVQYPVDGHGRLRLERLLELPRPQRAPLSAASARRSPVAHLRRRPARSRTRCRSPHPPKRDQSVAPRRHRGRSRMPSCDGVGAASS